MNITSKVLLFVAINGSKFDRIEVEHTNWTTFKITNRNITKTIRFKEYDANSFIFDIVNKALEEIQ